MPKALRYGLLILAIMGLLFLTAYIFRDYLTDWFSRATLPLHTEEISGQETLPFS